MQHKISIKMQFKAYFSLSGKTNAVSITKLNKKTKKKLK